MFRKVKQITAYVLIVSMLSSCISPAFANNQEGESTKEVETTTVVETTYAEETIETSYVEKLIDSSKEESKKFFSSENDNSSEGSEEETSESTKYAEEEETNKQEEDVDQAEKQSNEETKKEDNEEEKTLDDINLIDEENQSVNDVIDINDKPLPLKTFINDKKATNSNTNKSNSDEEEEEILIEATYSNIMKYDLEDDIATISQTNLKTTMFGTSNANEDPLTFIAEEAGSTITFGWLDAWGSKREDVFISKNGGAWEVYSAGTEIVLEKVNDKVSFKGNQICTLEIGLEPETHFNITGKVAATGSVTSLTDGCGIDPNVTLESSCYDSMFKDCTGLTTVPKLIAKNLKESCYASMFSGCTGLKTLPDDLLPSKNLAIYCYHCMFEQCTGLTTLPRNLLPANETKTKCYNRMFYGCSNLINAPNMPATKIAEACYSEMFSQCQSLTMAPQLLAKELSNYCYDSMFANCTSLEVPPAFPNSPDGRQLAEYCFQDMFNGCTKLVLNKNKDTGREKKWTVAAYTDPTGWNNRMFNNCTNVDFDGSGSKNPILNTVYYTTGKEENNYLTFVAKEALSQVKFSWRTGENVKISTDGGQNWSDYTKDTTITLTNIGDKVSFKGKDVTTDDTTNHFYMSGKIGIEGNVTSLLDENGNDPYVPLPEKCFKCMFVECEAITTMSNILPALNLSKECYYGMFARCNGLTSLPDNFLPADVLTENCYSYMFSTCVNLTTVPKNLLPATTLANRCYEGMFLKCEKLTIAPDLIAQNLNDYCYYYMFCNCESLIDAPIIDATNLAIGCCYKMFEECTNLVNPPVLHATKMEYSCYKEMFYKCTNLSVAPELIATQLADNCYDHMFYNCSKITAAPKLNATVLAQKCYSYMFYGCSSLTACPELPATNLEKNCYYAMFNGCSLIEEVPTLPATTLKENCYYGMFENCTNIILKQDSEALRHKRWNIQATKEVSGWNTNMFNNCTNVDLDGSGSKEVKINTTYYTKGIDTEPNYLTVVAKTSGNWCCVGKYYGTLEYRYNNGAWKKVPEETNWEMKQNDEISFRGKNFKTNLDSYAFQIVYGDVQVKGSVTSLIDEKGNDPYVKLEPYCFKNLFDFSGAITSIEGLELPALNLSNNCYEGMFKRCFRLTTIPKNFLQSATLAEACYKDMFWNCINLTKVDSNLLKATTLAPNCYEGMFAGTKLANIPNLPATTLAKACYKNMFDNFQGMKEVPEDLLKATTLAPNCYENMFIKSGITKTPKLLATNLEESCYKNMFSDCQNLTEVPVLTKANLATNCYAEMYKNCSKLVLKKEQEVGIRKEWLVQSLNGEQKDWNKNMFLGCPNVDLGDGSIEPKLDTIYYSNGVRPADYLTFIAEEANAKFKLNYIEGSVQYSLDSGNTWNDYTKGTQMTLANIGDKISFKGKNVRTNDQFYFSINMGKIKATGSVTSLTDENGNDPDVILTNNCYRYMFYGCTALTSAPKLPALSLSNYCYSGMFQGCTNLLTAPELPATDLKTACYEYMFENCTSLKIPPAILAINLEERCCQKMFKGCTNLVLLEEYAPGVEKEWFIPALEERQRWNEDMFKECPKVNIGNNNMPILNKTYYTIGKSKANYLTFIAEEENSAVLFNWAEGEDVQISKDRGQTWRDYIKNEIIMLATPGEAVSFKGKNVKTSELNQNHFYMKGKIRAEGCVTSLTDGIGNDPNVQLTDGCYRYMFLSCESLTSVPKLISEKLAPECYKGMFAGCTNINNLPRYLLPATELKNNCYQAMFNSCFALNNVHEEILLCATTLAENSYTLMFGNCTKLKFIPKFKNISLAKSCYESMFENCISIATVSKLPSTTLADSCYKSMFKNCISLESPPVLPATTLANNCYYEMFNGCTSMLIQNVKQKGIQKEWSIKNATTATDWNKNMFVNCPKVDLGSGSKEPQINTTYFIKGEGKIDNALTFIAEDAGSTIKFSWLSGENVQISKDDGYTWSDYTKGDTITLTNIGDKVSFKGKNVITADETIKATNHFVMSGKIKATGSVTSLTDEYGEDTNVTLTNKCYSNMFKNCTALTSVPRLIAINLSDNCYENMFEGCTRLTQIQEDLLPATTLTEGCYSGMFKGCTGLTTIPEKLLHSTTLAKLCYKEMFMGCNQITKVPDNMLPAMTLSDNCYEGMFQDCTKLIKTPELNAPILEDYCYSKMFKNCDTLATPSLLPAISLGLYCYDSMFYNCDNLVLTNIRSETSGITKKWMISALDGPQGWNRAMFMDCLKVNIGEFNKQPLLNTTYYTLGEEPTHMVTVKYIVDGIVKATQSIVEGSNITKPIPPERKGYKLDGWYEDETYTSEFNFNFPIYSSTSLYAKWDKANIMSYFVDDVLIATQSVASGSYATKIASPSRAEHQFDGWYTDNTYEKSKLFDFDNTKIEKDTEVYARQIKIHTVTFIDEGKTWKTIKVLNGDKITTPSTPSKAEHIFVGWYKDDLITPFDFNQAITSDTTIWVKWTRNYTVVFKDADEDINYATYSVLENTKVKRHSTPSKIGYVFDDWYEYDLITPFDFDNTKIKKDTEIFAKWNKILLFTYNIGGHVHATQSVLIGEKAKKIATPTQIKAIFDGWYKDNTYTIKFNFNKTQIMKDTTVYGRFIPIHDVTFKDDDTIYATVSVLDGNKVNEPEKNPEKENHIFKGWYEENKITRFDFDKEIKKDINIIASWTEIHKVVFKDDDTIYATRSVAHGNTVLKQASPSKTNYHFNGWYEEDKITPFDFDKSIVKNQNVIASWTEIHTVTLHMERIGIVNTEEVLHGHYATRPNPPTKIKYVFDNWYKSATSSELFDFENTPITKDITVYGRWTDHSLTFIAEEDGSTIKLNWDQGSIAIVRNKDGEWKYYNKGDEIKLNKGEHVSFAGYKIRTNKDNHFEMTGKIRATGSVTSLTDAVGKDPEVVLSEYCYAYMFSGCDALTQAPILKAEYLTEGCYDHMFSGCTNLTEVPEDLLPATTLIDSCYKSMFEGCKNLIDIPKNLLPSTNLSSKCYQTMFATCTSLKDIPDGLLPASTLAKTCYAGMFTGCVGIATLSQTFLKATTLAEECYRGMFSNCTNLAFLIDLPATELKEKCYHAMFSNTKITLNKEFAKDRKRNWKIPATTLATASVLAMFFDCDDVDLGGVTGKIPEANTVYYTLGDGVVPMWGAAELQWDNSTKTLTIKQEVGNAGTTSGTLVNALKTTSNIDKDQIKKIVFATNSNSDYVNIGNDCGFGMFEISNFSTVSEIDMTYADMTNAPSDCFKNMFHGSDTYEDNSIEKIIMPDKGMTNHTALENTFASCLKLKTIKFAENTLKNISDLDLTNTGFYDTTWAGDDNTQYKTTLEMLKAQKAKTIAVTYTQTPYHYIVTFETNGGTKIASISVASGSIIQNPPTTTKSGYTFENWYTTSTFSEVFIINTTPITNDITLYANWTKNPDPAPTPTPGPSSGGGGGGGGGGSISAGAIIEGQIVPNADVPKSQTINIVKPAGNSLPTANVESTIWTVDPVSGKYAMAFLNANGQIEIAKNGFFNLEKKENRSIPGLNVNYVDVNKVTYYFDAVGIMQTGWITTADAKTYFFDNAKTNNEGVMAQGWKMVLNEWYYFDTEGALQKNIVTPDGYTIDANGKWVNPNSLKTTEQLQGINALNTQLQLQLQTAITPAQKSYTQAVSNYQQALAKYQAILNAINEKKNIK